MSDYDPYHFSSELIDMLVSVIPLLNRSKRGVLTFFRSCGVPDSMLTDLTERVAADASSISKYEIARTVLRKINDGGDRLLRPRREVIKQVTEFEDFSLCWPDDELKAKGLVSDVRRHVNVKDSFTRMQQAEESHRLDEARRRRAAAEVKQQRRDTLAALRSRLAALASMPNAQQRGLSLEGILSDLFTVDGLSVRDSFTIRDDSGQVQEQIDGLVSSTVGRFWSRRSGIPHRSGRVTSLGIWFGCTGGPRPWASLYPPRRTPTRRLPSARPC